MITPVVATNEGLNGRRARRPQHSGSLLNQSGRRQNRYAQHAATGEKSRLKQAGFFGKTSFNSGFLRNAGDVGWLMQTNPSLKRTRYSNTASVAD
jgi:hypothetical protein